MAVIGIDLGTTNSLAAYWKDQAVQLIENEKGEVLLPSVVGAVSGEGFLVGREAKERLLTHPEDTAASFKCFMGTAREYELDGRVYTPMELSAMVLERIRKNAEYVLKEEIEEAIITVPAYFNDKQRSDTKKAAQIAGLKADRLINEPSAAALAYQMKYGAEEKTLLVFDFGGGTLDLSYVECFDNVIEILAVAGDNHLGGDDIDRAIGAYFCRENGLQEESLSLEDQAQLRKLSEQAKCALESQETVPMELQVEGRSCQAVLEEEILFEICMPIFGKIRKLFLHILEDAGSRVSQIDDLIMVGGSSRLPVVKRFLTELLGKEPVVLGDTDKVVALGAGAYAGIRQRREEIRDMLLTDVCPFTLGIGVLNRSNREKDILSPMIERNSTLPASHRSRFVTTSDFQKEIMVRIYQGEEYYVDNNVFLGQVSIEVAQKPAGQAWIEVQFTYDINGILHVAAENEMGERRQVLLANQTLSEAELRQYTKEMEKVMVPPVQQPENQELLARFLHEYENSVGGRREQIGAMVGWILSKLESGRRKEVRNGVETAKRWLEQLEIQRNMQEELLFDGELKEPLWEEEPEEGFREEPEESFWEEEWEDLDGELEEIAGEKNGGDEE